MALFDRLGKIERICVFVDVGLLMGFVFLGRVIIVKREINCGEYFVFSLSDK